MSPEEFAVKDFEMALNYLTAQFERLWQRFSFFLTVQMALFGLFGWFVFDRGIISAIPIVCVFGFFISLLWYVVSAQDRALVVAYRARTRLAAERIGRMPLIGASDYADIYVGGEAKVGRWKLGSWYCHSISITRLPVWISLLLMAVWIALWWQGADWLQSFLPRPTRD